MKKFCLLLVLLFLILATVPFLISCFVLPTSTGTETQPTNQTNNPTASGKTTAPIIYTTAKLIAPELVDTGSLSATQILTSPSALIGQPYNIQLPAFGGRPPYHWEMVSGTLPAGLNLDAAGRIYGNPNKVGHYQFTLILTDSQGTQAIQSVRITEAQVLPTPTNQGESGPHDVYPAGSNPIAPTVYYTPPAININAAAVYVIPGDFISNQYFAVRPCVQNAGDSCTFRPVGLPKGLTCDNLTGQIEGEISGITSTTPVTIFLHGSNGRETQVTVSLQPVPTYTPTYVPPTTSSTYHPPTTTTQVNPNNQYIKVYVSQFTYGVADIWVDGYGPYRQQCQINVGVGTHTIRIKTYGSTQVPAFDKTVTGSISAGKYWDYEVK